MTTIELAFEGRVITATIQHGRVDLHLEDDFEDAGEAAAFAARLRRALDATLADRGIPVLSRTTRIKEAQHA